MFDPYLKWLGIRPEDRPADHYRLLGIDRFEDDLDVIENAAHRQAAFVKTFRLGEHVDCCEKLLAEIATARLCLLDPRKKETYDNSLRIPVPPPAPEPTQPSLAEPEPAAVHLVRRVAPKGRRKRSTHSRHFVGIVFGGIAGIAIGAALLNYGAGIDVLGVFPSETEKELSTKSGKANQSRKRRLPTDSDKGKQKTREDGTRDDTQTPKATDNTIQSKAPEVGSSSKDEDKPTVEIVPGPGESSQPNDVEAPSDEQSPRDQEHEGYEVPLRLDFDEARTFVSLVDQRRFASVGIEELEMEIPDLSTLGNAKFKRNNSRGRRLSIVFDESPGAEIRIELRKNDDEIGIHIDRTFRHGSTSLAMTRNEIHERQEAVALTFAEKQKSFKARMARLQVIAKELNSLASRKPPLNSVRRPAWQASMTQLMLEHKKLDRSARSLKGTCERLQRLQTSFPNVVEIQDRVDGCTLNYLIWHGDNCLADSTRDTRNSG